MPNCILIEHLIIVEINRRLVEFTLTPVTPEKIPYQCHVILQTFCDHVLHLSNICNILFPMNHHQYNLREHFNNDQPLKSFFIKIYNL